MNLAKKILKKGKKVKINNPDYIENGSKYEGLWVVYNIEKNKLLKKTEYLLAKQNRNSGGMWGLYLFDSNICFTNDGQILLREKEKGYIICELDKNYKYHETAKNLLKKLNLWRER